MKTGRGLILHFVLLACATALAVYVWTRDKQPKALAQAEVTIWSAKPADVTGVTYESKTRKVTLEAKSDAAGRFFLGSIVKTPAPKPAAADAGADAAAEVTKPAEPTTTTFVSVGGAEKLLDDIAPLKAYRSVGRSLGDRAGEFGLAEPEGTLLVSIGGQPRKLAVGGPTPGGADRYVRDEASGEVFVIKGDIVRSLDTADAKLVERELHDWKEADVEGAKVTAGGKARDVTRGTDGTKKFWADPANAGANDETVSNWFTKLDRLRPNEYALTPPEGAESVVRVEYTGGGKGIGFLEVFKAPSASGGKADYYVLSERIRHHAKVTASLAEQVEQDVASVAK
jgi:hypothetical protein